MIDTPYLYRHSYDPNLWIYNGYYYNGMPLVWQQGPFIHNYLQRIDETIQGALQEHPSVMAVRVDLRLPFQFDWRCQPDWRPVFSRFTASLKSKIKARQAKKIRDGIRFHPTEVHFIWTREFGQNGHPHYHCVLFFNKQTFRGLGEFNPYSGSLYGMISSAWASALGMDAHVADGLVSIPRNPIYRIRNGERYDDLFRRISYFAKLASKLFGSGSHNFGTSRTPGN
ncbi:inovirus Gp2 family protein [Marinobacter xiaoshiensis]|uniref:Inovirus Gp2 family protein n=1 Tax=Marinobacter xiaoshiensis TaxID=3073652 RepID=A0ABU2HJH0_9GAMM|nr:inovirus Gp2 family protein [Marinobacter sp. F60267]MDS1311214.1 inovirus Gp2 family protein [Marinobacter sp. F60267]